MKAKWPWTVLAGMAIMLVGYIWLLYDPSRLAWSFSVALVGVAVAIAGLAMRR